MNKQDAPLPQPNMKRIFHFIACGLGSGMLKPAPGTWGSLAALPFAYLLLMLSWPVQVLVVVLASLFGFWVCGKVSDDLKVHDHPSIVWDEFCGIWLAMLFVPLDDFWIAAPIAFLAFRFFDILKPGPIGWLDRKLKGGLGIMADDLLAGIFALMVVHTGLHFA